MTEEVLEKGLKLQDEIVHLQNFVAHCKRNWKIFRVNRYKRIGIETAYGGVPESMQVAPELAERILETIEQYIAEKKEEFEKLGADMRETE